MCQQHLSKHPTLCKISCGTFIRWHNLIMGNSDSSSSPQSTSSHPPTPKDALIRYSSPHRSPSPKAPNININVRTGKPMSGMKRKRSHATGAYDFYQVFPPSSNREPLYVKTYPSRQAILDAIRLPNCGLTPDEKDKLGDFSKLNSGRINRLALGIDLTLNQRQGKPITIRLCNHVPGTCAVSPIPPFPLSRPVCPVKKAKTPKAKSGRKS